MEPPVHARNTARDTLITQLMVLDPDDPFLTALSCQVDRYMHRLDDLRIALPVLPRQRLESSVGLVATVCLLLPQVAILGL